MQQTNLDASKSNVGFMVGGTILTLAFFFGTYTFFEQTSVVAKLLAGGSSILLLVLLVPFWIKVLKMMFVIRRDC